MQINEVTVQAPKTKQASLNKGAYLVEQMEIIETKRVNLMKNISDTKEKLKKLEETLSRYELQLEKISLLKEKDQKEIELLQSSFDLTMAEILETKSSLLRSQISSLQEKAGVTRTGKTDQF